MCEAKFFLTQPILPPDVKGVSLPQPETPFNSPIRSRPCPGRLFFARIEHQALPFAQAALAFSRRSLDAVLSSSGNCVRLRRLNAEALRARQPLGLSMLWTRVSVAWTSDGRSP